MIYSYVLSVVNIARVAVWPQELGIAIEQEKSFIDFAHSLKSAKSSHSRPDLPIPYAAPRNEQEQTVADIWQELLGIERVGIHDNYFELGGHSLLATRIISRLKATFQVDLPLQILFETPTIAEIAEEIDQRLARRMDPPEMKELLDKLEDLSDEEAQRFFDEEMD